MPVSCNCINTAEMSNIRFRDPVLLNEYILKTSADIPKTYLFLDYLKWGGLPQRFEFINEQSRMIYLEDVLNSIVYRDVLVDLKRADMTLTERLLAYLYENTASILSDHSIYEQIKQQMENVKKQDL